jgi:FemAB-related protein (PEP-CTERM system-associated)
MHLDLELWKSEKEAAEAVEVRRFEPGEAAKWDSFVARCAEATFFHRSEWRDILEREFHHRCHYLMAERNGQVTGVLPLCEARSRLFGHALISLPFTPYGGPAADDVASEQQLITKAVELARHLAVQHLELRNTKPRCPEWPRQDRYVTFRKTLLNSVEANLLAIPRKQRAMVRKGIRNGLTAEVDTGVAQFFMLYADNMHRHGVPLLPRRYFETLRATFNEDCEILIVKNQEGRPISGVMSFYFRDEILPSYAGDTVDARELAANDFKYWELMRRACERGVRVFDFGRSKRGSGAFDFKRNWGFESSPLAYEHCLLARQHVPQNNPASPKYRALTAVWRRLPLPLATRLGPLVVRKMGLWP